MKPFHQIGILLILMGLSLGLLQELPTQASESKSGRERMKERQQFTQRDSSFETLPPLQAPPTLPNLPISPGPNLFLPAPRCLRPIQSVPYGLFSRNVASNRLGIGSQLAVEYALLGIPDQPVQIILNSQLYPESTMVAFLKIAEAYDQIQQPTLVFQTLSQASSWVSQLESSYLDIQSTQILFFTEIANRFVKIGHLDQALHIAEQQKNKWDQEEILVKVVTALAEVGQIDQAIEVMKLLQEGSRKNDALLAISAYYVKIGKLNQAFALIQSLNDSCNQSFTLNDLVKQLAEVNNPNFSLQVAQVIKDKDVKAEALLEVADGYLKAGETTQTVSLVSEVLELIKTSNSDLFKIELLVKCANLLRKAGQLQYATEILNQALELHQKLRTSTNIIPTYPVPN